MPRNSPPNHQGRHLRTWSSLGALGRRPSEYEVVTHAMNHTVREPPLEMAPDARGNRWLATHRDGCTLDLGPLDAFRDPDALTYRSYVTAMDDCETYVDGLLQQYSGVADADATLRAPALDLLQHAWTPTRYLGHGLQMLSAHLQQLARSSYVANCAAFQAADQLRRVHRVACRTRQLADAHPSRGYGRAERALWEDDPLWQPMRRAVERLLVTHDWDRVFVGLALVVKPLSDELHLKSFASIAQEAGDTLDALLAENLYLDARRSRRWSIAAAALLSSASEAQAATMRDWVADWHPLAERIIEAGSTMLARSVPGVEAERIADDVLVEWHRVQVQAGL